MITFDNLILEAFIEEEKHFFCGARINKIQQPTRREFILFLRNQGQTRKLYININPQYYHICFLNEENEQRRGIEIPKQPPMFCMLLRKYLENSKIAKISQVQCERIIELYIESYNELGDKIYLCLAIELMGKHSNIILYNTDTNIILGCAHNVGSDKSQIREVYGQIPYTYPPKQNNNEYIKQKYAFLYSFKKDIFDDISPNSIIDNYYSRVIQKEKFKSLKSEYNKNINSKLKKVINSLNEMKEQKLKSENCNKYRLYGDLLMANLYNLKDHSLFASVYDYENNEEINIELNETKTIKENANAFYKKYNKTKSAVLKLNELIKFQANQKIYLDSIQYSINCAKTLQELNELKDEIYDNSPQETKNKKHLNPIKINLENQTTIYIGKNNKQNDYIISKIADEEDLWFHTKDCTGSHVLLKTQMVTDALILKCAKLAKQYSSGSESSKVGVIYTKRKYLRKPPKANPGYVTYKNEKEIVID